MEFTAAAEQYDDFMGRYTRTLAPALVDAAAVRGGMGVLDVGCGPGGLTDTLADKIGEERVAAIDPAPQFVAACRRRHPAADVREGVAEELPWADGSFDATLSCLVIAFMKDADQGVREMSRVTRRGGTVAACMWDIPGGGMTMLSTFWKAARQVDPNVAGEQRRPGVTQGDIADRFRRAGLQDVEDGVLQASADYASFEQFWEPFTFGVGPAGQYLASLQADRQDRVREACRAALPENAFSLAARAWYARGTVPAKPPLLAQSQSRAGLVPLRVGKRRGRPALGGACEATAARHMQRLGTPQNLTETQSGVEAFEVTGLDEDPRA